MYYLEYLFPERKLPVVGVLFSVCSGCIFFGMIDFSLFARILAIILYVVLYKLMGLKSFDVCGFLFFGINAIKVWFASVSILHEWKKALIALYVTFPTMCQYLIKYSTINPCGPDDLFGAIS